MVTNYKGFKVVPNNYIQYCRALRNRRIIEYNSGFYLRITPNQRKFMLEWCIRNYKCRDVYKADRKTLNWYLINVAKTKDEILDLYLSLKFKNKRTKEKRLAALGYEYTHYEKVNWVVKFGRFWRKIVEFLRIPAYGENEL